MPQSKRPIQLCNLVQGKPYSKDLSSRYSVNIPFKNKNCVDVTLKIVCHNFELEIVKNVINVNRIHDEWKWQLILNSEGHYLTFKPMYIDCMFKLQWYTNRKCLIFWRIIHCRWASFIYIFLNKTIINLTCFIKKKI